MVETTSVCWHCQHGQFKNFSKEERAKTYPPPGAKGECEVAHDKDTVILEQGGYIASVDLIVEALKERGIPISKIVHGALVIKSQTPCKVFRVREELVQAFDPIPNLNPPQQTNFGRREQP